MRRATWFPPFALLIALWLPLFVGEPNLLSPCHMHGALAVSHAAAGHDHAAPMSAHSMADSRHSHQNKGESHCGCIDCCTPAPAQAPLAQPAVVATIVATYEPPVPGGSVDARAAAAPDFARPYTTGPPRA